jgi:6-phosphogluconate dehydrogenase (decarboxylating)
MQLGLVGLGKMGFTMRQRLHGAARLMPIYDALRLDGEKAEDPMRAVSALRNQFGGHAVQRFPLSG